MYLPNPSNVADDLETFMTEYCSSAQYETPSALKPIAFETKNKEIIHR